MLRVSVFFCFLLTILACGGGVQVIDGSSFKVTWPARTRTNITGVSSAISGRVTFKNASTAGADIVVNVDRIPNPVAYTQSYKVGQRVNLIAPHATFEFYSGSRQTGSVVARGTAELIWRTTSMEMVDIVLDKQVTSVAVLAPTPMTTATPPFDLLFLAKDASNASLALTPGSAKWTVLSGGGKIQLTPSGRLTPTKVGTAVIKVEVDGISSDPYTVTVN